MCVVTFYIKIYNETMLKKLCNIEQLSTLSKEIINEEIFKMDDSRSHFTEAQLKQ